MTGEVEKIVAGDFDPELFGGVDQIVAGHVDPVLGDHERLVADHIAVD